MLNGGIAFLCGGGATVFVHMLGLLGLAGRFWGAEVPSGWGISEFGHVRGRIYSSLRVLATALECIFRVFRLNLRLKLRETPMLEQSLRMDI